MMVTQNITLNGTTSFSAFGKGPFSWSGAYIESVYIDNAGSATEDTLNLSMTGAAWRIRRLSLGSESENAPLNVNITDTNDGVQRRIDWLQLGEFADTTITLFNSRVRFIDGGIGGTVNLTLGSGELNYANFIQSSQTVVTAGSGGIDRLLLSQGNDTLTAGSGYIEDLDFRGGNNVLNVGSGGIGRVRFAEGNHTINGGTGSIQAIVFDDFVPGARVNTINNLGFFASITVFGSATNNFTFVGSGQSVSLGSGVSTVNLVSGFYGSLLSFSGTNTVTVGADAEVRSIGFSGGVDIITVRGNVEQIQVGGNNDRVEVLGDGRVDSLMLGDGNNTFILNGDWTWAVTAFSGNDTASVNSGQIDQLYLGSGNNTVTVGAEAFVGSLRTNEGADRLTVDGGDIIQATLGGGRNTVLVRSGRIETLTLNEGADRITVRDGEVMSINAMGGNNTIQLGTGYTGFVGTYEGRDTVILGTGDVFTIGTGNGNDTIDATAGRFDYLDAGQGNDVVTLGARGARFVVLGDGDDTLSIAPAVPEWGIEVQGDSGVDTVDLSRFTANLTLDLGISQWQNPAAPGGAGSPPAQGYLAMIQVENAIGGSGADAITGSEDDNVLTGGRGADTLSGGDGNDTLVGGRDNDSLTGGLGDDVFRFVQADGRDTIAGFVRGDDLIELREANALGDLTITQNGADVRIDFGALRITVQNALLADIADSANFLF
jgi:Ca2+-binding RTX toxin-like protein